MISLQQNNPKFLPSLPVTKRANWIDAKITETCIASAEHWWVLVDDSDEQTSWWNTSILYSCSQNTCIEPGGNQSKTTTHTTEVNPPVSVLWVT